MASPIGATGTLTGPIVRAEAKLRYSTVTPMKARRVVDLVRGLPADEALALLRFAPQAASEPVYKVLESAVANAQHKAQERNERLDVEDLVVSQAYVDEGPTLKRFRPRAQGRAYRIRKRTSHITIHVESWSAEAETLATKRAVPKRVKPNVHAARSVAPAAPASDPEKAAPANAAKKAAQVAQVKDAAPDEAAEKPAKKTATAKTEAKTEAAPAKKAAAKKAAEPEAVDKPAKKTAAKKAAEPEAADKPAKKTAAKKTAAKADGPDAPEAADKPAKKTAAKKPAADEGGTR